MVDDPFYQEVFDMLDDSELREIRERQEPVYKPITMDDLMAAHERVTLECIETISHGISLYTKLKEAHRHDAGLVASMQAIINIEILNLIDLRKELKNDREKRKRFKNL